MAVLERESESSRVGEILETNRLIESDAIIRTIKRELFACYEARAAREGVQTISFNSYAYHRPVYFFESLCVKYDCYNTISRYIMRSCLSLFLSLSAYISSVDPG